MNRAYALRRTGMDAVLIVIVIGFFAVGGWQAYKAMSGTSDKEPR